MPLKQSKGNMYDWVSHTHAHLGGECSHKCKYCYVDNPLHGRPANFTGPIRLIESEFNVNYGEDKTIFIEHMNDLFADDVPNDFIRRIISHCNLFPKNTYVFQTKNPHRYADWFDFFPFPSFLGTTIETNREIAGISNAPLPIDRYKGMLYGHAKLFPRFVTIEPVLDFDVDILAGWIRDIKPTFINLGADSKNHNLPEPTVEKIMQLVSKLKEYDIDLKEKHNLQRLVQK